MPLDEHPLPRAEGRADGIVPGGGREDLQPGFAAVIMTALISSA